MSLVASTAFQNNPAIQPRAFSVMGCLAKEDVDDDLLYQVLVALRSALARYIDQTDFEMLASIITSLTKMTENLPSSSRYLHQMFWLSMSLIRVGPPSLFMCSSSLLQAVLRVIASSGSFKDGRIGFALMQGRSAVEEAAAAIDDLFEIRFDAVHFSFCATLCIVKGLSDPTTRSAALKTLTTFLEVAVANALEDDNSEFISTFLPYMLPVASRAATSEELKEIMWQCGMPENTDDSPSTFQDILPRLNSSGVGRTDLFLSGILALVEFKTGDENVQIKVLEGLESIAITRPDVFNLM